MQQPVTPPARLLEQLWAHTPGGWATLWARRKATGDSVTRWIDLAQRGAATISAYQEAARLDADGYDVYISTCPARKRGQDGGRIKQADVAMIPAYYLDIDTQQDPGKAGKGAPVDVQTALGLLQWSNVPPTCCVSSGHGLHAYWVLSDPWDLSRDSLAEAKAALRGFADAVAADMGWPDLDTHASEPARVLRIDGTHNHKGDPLPVELVLSGGREYTREELRAYAQAILPPDDDQDLDEVPAGQLGKPTGGEATGRDYLAAGLAHDARLRELWDGAGRTGDESADDLALLNKLAYWCNRDPDRMRDAFLGSPYCAQKDPAHQRKAARKDYLDATIRKAITDCASTAADRDGEYQAQRQATAAQDFAGCGDAPLPELTLDELRRYELNDMGTAKLLARMVRGRAVYVPEYRYYFVYRRGRWIPGGRDDLPAHNLVSDVVRYVRTLIPPAPKPTAAGTVRDLTSGPKAAQADPWEDHRKYYARYGQLKYRETLLRDTRREISAGASIFDRPAYLLNLRNGTYNLDTGELQPHNPGDMLSLQADVEYVPGAYDARWVQFISEIMEGNQERARYLQKALGYALQGEANEECYFTAIGEGTRNGKGTLFDSVMGVLGRPSEGGYANQMDFATIAHTRQAQDGSRATPDLARLRGARLVLTNEPPRGVSLNEALLKQLTGNDDIVGRPLYGDVLQFKPVFKLFITANNLPTIADDSLFRSGRVKVLPFTRSFGEDERDTRLKAYFRQREVKSAILNWLLDGYRMYREEGLADTEEGRRLTARYRRDNDYTQQFLDECFDPTGAGTVTIKALRMRYANWCLDIGAKALGLKLFKEEVKRKGIQLVVIHKQDHVKGSFRVEPSAYASTGV